MAHPRQWKVAAKTTPTPASEAQRLAEVERMKRAAKITTTNWERLAMMARPRRRRPA